MAERATETQETKHEAASNGASAKAGRGYKTISKVEAVRRSLEKLGREASNAEIQADVLERFGVEMTTNHVSTCKVDLAKKAKAVEGHGAKKAVPATKSKAQPARPAVRREQAAKTPPAAKAAPTVVSNGEGPAIPLDDILTVEDIVRRVGAGHLRTSIDVMEK